MHHDAPDPGWRRDLSQAGKRPEDGTECEDERRDQKHRSVRKEAPHRLKHRPGYLDKDAELQDKIQGGLGQVVVDAIPRRKVDPDQKRRDVSDQCGDALDDEQGESAAHATVKQQSDHGRFGHHARHIEIVLQEHVDLAGIERTLPAAGRAVPSGQAIDSGLLGK